MRTYPTAPVSCPRCASGPQPGAVALSIATRHLYPHIGTLGIFNCRSVRGGSSFSIHACGRAWDAATKDHDAGWALARELVANAARLGIQRIIWWRQIWTASSGWRAYTGSHPHTDHLHIELRPEASTGSLALTEEYIFQVLGQGTSVPAKRPTLRRGSPHHAEVRELQVLLGEYKLYTGKVDGLFGPLTEQAVRDYQSMHGLVVDGIVGNQTWDSLLATREQPREQPQPPKERKSKMVLIPTVSKDNVDEYCPVWQPGEVILYADHGDSYVRVATGVAGDFYEHGSSNVDGKRGVHVPHGTHVRLPIRSNSGGPAHGVTIEWLKGRPCAPSITGQ